MNKFLFTCGDINGIGPEIVIKALNQLTKKSRNQFYFICPKNIFKKTARKIKPEFDFVITENIAKNDISVNVIDIGEFVSKIGKPTKHSGKAAFTAIKLSYQLAKEKKIDGIITAPISKTAMGMIGIKYPGHTEMYAEWCGVKNYVMIFLSKKMKAALITIHEPVKNISSLITKKILRNKLKIIADALQNDLRIQSPHIAILGLNPHAGESGLIGLEEEEVVKPFINEFNLSNNNQTMLSGPFSPDAFFANHLYKNYNLIIGMYHDQVLIPFKMLNFNNGVNYTAGLPIVRTSPDHGVAYDIAGKNLANPSSIIEAYRFAEKIVRNRKQNE